MFIYNDLNVKYKRNDLKIFIIFTYLHWNLNKYLHVLQSTYFRVTLFSRGNHPAYIHETLFSQFFISSSIFLH